MPGITATRQERQPVGLTARLGCDPVELTLRRWNLQVSVQSLVVMTGRQAADLSLPEHEVCTIGFIVWLAASRVRLLDEFKMR